MLFQVIIDVSFAETIASEAHSDPFKRNPYGDALRLRYIVLTLHRREAMGLHQNDAPVFL